MMKNLLLLVLSYLLSSMRQNFQMHKIRSTVVQYKFMKDLQFFFCREQKKSRLRSHLCRPHVNVGDLDMLGRLEYVPDMVCHVLGLQALDRLVEGLRLARIPLVH